MRKAVAALLVAFVLVGGMYLVVDAQGTFQRFENIIAKSVRSLGTLTVGGNATVGGTLATTGASTAASYASTGSMTAGTFIASTVAATQTVVADGAITAVGSVQPISAAGAVGTSNLTVLPNGTVLMLVNVGSNTITITDTGTNKLSADIALGAGDSLTVVSNGVNWYQLATANN